MNRKETAYLMAVIKTAYPEYYRQSSEIGDAINLWHEMFRQDDSVLIGEAVKRFIKQDDKGFPPKIGQINNLARDIKAEQRREQERERTRLELEKPKREITEEEKQYQEKVLAKMRAFLNG